MSRLAGIGLAVLAALLWLPAAAGAHSIVRVNAGVISYLSSDAISLNTLEITDAGADVRLSDPTVDGGIDPGSCRPGATDGNGFVTEVFCPRAGAGQVRVELGEREDRMTASSVVPVLALGGNGADTLVAGGPGDILVGNEGNDTLDGGAGNDQVNGSEGDDVVRGSAGDDVLQAGPGADEADGGPGADDVRARDGVADRIACGEGGDRVDADVADEAAADCEAVTRATTPPPPDGDAGGPGGGGGAGGSGGSGGSRADTAPPVLEVGGATSQRLRRSRTIRILATSSERGTVAASGFLRIAGVALPVKSRSARVATAGGGAEITVRLSRKQWRQARRALARGRRVTVGLGVVATDLAGNSTARKAPSIRLRR